MHKLCFILLFSFNLLGQNNIPKGAFLEDTIHLGEIVNYSLVYRHLDKNEVFFPGKNYNFAPFELVDKIYFPSKTTNNITLDSAIYQLRTFSLEKTQNLKLPIYLAKQKDSLLIYSNIDSVIIYLMKDNGQIGSLRYIQKVLPFKSKANLIEIFLTLVVIFTAAGAWWIIFGKTVKSQINLFTIFRMHSDFKSNFLRSSKTLNKPNAIKALNLWKNYMGRLLGKSLTSMTTTELIENMPDYNQDDTLREIDKYIYGTDTSENIKKAINKLLQIAEIQYNKTKKMNQINFKK